jgi:Lar family restriction alleviation protein
MTAASEEKPARCPWCGDDFVHTQRTGDDEDPDYIVGCDYCEARGPTESTEREAIAAWNRVALVQPIPHPEAPRHEQE